MPHEFNDGLFGSGHKRLFRRVTTFCTPDHDARRLFDRLDRGGEVAFRAHVADLADEKVSDAGTQILMHEFSADGVVFERNGVCITAFAVNHGPLIKPAYGYRVDFAGRSVLLSGDTKFDESLIAQGADVDLLIHKVAIAPKPLLDAPWAKAIINHHTTPEEAGVVFSRTKPRMDVFSHITLIGDADNPRPGDKDIEARTRTTWSGNLVVGTDLTRFVLTADAVVTKRIDHATGVYEK